MIRSLELYPGPKADFREACILLRSDDSVSDRVLLLYTRVVVSAERLLGDRLRILVGTEEDPAQFFSSQGLPIERTEPFFRRLNKNRGFYSVMLRGSTDDDSISLSKRGYIDMSGGHAQGLRLLQAGQPQRAAIALNQALEKNPQLHGLHFLLGRCYEAMEDSNNAFQSYTSELKASRHSLAPQAIGKILEERGDKETARLYFQEAMRRDGTNLAALTSLALGYLYSGEFAGFWQVFSRAYLLAGTDVSVQEIVNSASEVFGIERQEVIARLNIEPLPQEVVEEILLNKMLFENGAFVLGQTAFERFLSGLESGEGRDAVAIIYSELVRSSISSVSPFEASRVVPKLHYSLEGLKRPDLPELMIHYGAVLETAFRDLRWFIDPLWANYLVEDLEDLQSEAPEVSDLGVYLTRVYGNLLEDQVHLGRDAGVRTAQDRIERLLKREKGNNKLPYTYMTCLSYLTTLAATRKEPEMALVFLDRSLKVASEHGDDDKVRRHLPELLEGLIEKLVSRQLWELLKLCFDRLAEAPLDGGWKAMVQERGRAKLMTVLPKDSPDLPWLNRLKEREGNLGVHALSDPVIRGIRSLVGVPVPGAILIVKSDPEGREIFINGRGVGITPRRFEDFPAGEYTVGVGNVYQRVELRDGSPVRLKFNVSDGQVDIDESFEYTQPEAEMVLAGKLETLDRAPSFRGGILDVRDEDGVKVVRVRRSVTPIRELSFQEELLSLLEEDGPGPLVVDLSQVKWIGSLGIALLAKLYSLNGRRDMVLVRGRRLDFRVAGKVCQEVKTIFDYLLRFVPAAASLDHAVDLVRSGGRVN